jgi:flagellar protein FliO/FliZ
MNTSIPLQDVPEWMMYLRVVFAFLFVIALIYLSSALARKYGLDKHIKGTKGKETTLSVSETLYLDPRRRLVLVRSGKKEHLLLLAPTGDVVIASQDVEAKHDAP